jgi:hypothetical protein
MLQHELFGLDPTGWHFACLVLHGAVLVLAAEVLRRLQVPLAVAAATLWLFAAHPVHTESVAWISGSTDSLLALFLLAAYASYLAGWRSSSLGFFGLALLTKETAVVFPALVFASEWVLEARDGAGSRIRRSALAAAPLLALVVAYALARLAVLGRHALPAPRDGDVLTALATLPRLAGIYLRHLFWPVPLSPVYALREVAPSGVGLVPPLAALVSLVALGTWLWRRDALSKISLAWFVVFLLPVLDVSLLSTDRLVHDRYLYLPSLGALLLVAHSLSKLVPGRAVLAIAVVLCAVLSSLTVRYTRAWFDDVALWEHAARTSPESAYALANLG